MSVTRAACLTMFLFSACADVGDVAAPDQTTAAEREDVRPDGRRDHERHHCVLPWDIDWNKVLHLPHAALVIPACPEIDSNDKYVPLLVWQSNAKGGVSDSPIVYPEGYTPTHAAPMRDFLSKLVAVRYVVQPGGQEYIFPAQHITELTTTGALWHDAGFFTVPQYEWPVAAFLGKLPPLPPGDYQTEIHLIMSDMSCDGIGDDISANCVVPGDNFFFAQVFAVVP